VQASPVSLPSAPKPVVAYFHRNHIGSQPCSKPAGRTRSPGHNPQLNPDSAVSQSSRSPTVILRSFRSSVEVLCTFPSRYLYAIGVPIRDLALEDWYLPSSACTFKQAYSSTWPRPSIETSSGYHTPWHRGYTGFGSRLPFKARLYPTLPCSLSGAGFRDGLGRVHSQLLAASHLISFSSA